MINVMNMEFVVVMAFANSATHQFASAYMDMFLNFRENGMCIIGPIDV